MKKSNYRPLDVKKFREKKSIIVPTNQAIKDVVPITWGDEVTSGNKSVLLVENK